MLVRNRTSHSMLERRKNGRAALEDSLTVFYKTKHTLALVTELKTYVHIKSYTWKDTNGLYKLAQTGK